MAFLEFISDKTLNIAFAMTHFMTLVVLMVVYPIYQRIYIKTMAIGHGLMAFGIFLLTLRDMIPDFLSIIIGNILLVGGAYLVLIGFLQMAKLKARFRLYAVLLGIFSCLHIIYTYSDQNVSYRIINYSIFIILGITFFLFFFLRGMGSKPKLSFLVIGLAYLIDLVNNVSRIINVLWMEEVLTLFRGAAILKIYLILSILMIMVRIIALLMKNTRDLVD